MISCASHIAAVSKPLKVLCVDDNRFVGDAVRLKLDMASGMEWAGYLPNANRLIEAVNTHAPDVVLLDVDMPGRDPFDALEELSRRNPNVRVLMLTAHVRRDLIDRAIEAGAWGYLAKSEIGESLAEAIRQVAHGEFVMTPEVQSHHWR
jgi:two-component system, NarL family, response regulator DesR